MRFLADESCDFAAVRALRADGHDVTAVSEIEQWMTDAAVAGQALREGRVLLTEDRDFGQLAYVLGQRAGTVIYLRYPARARRSLGTDVVSLVRQHGERLSGSFVVMQPGRVRITRAPIVGLP